MRDYGSCTLCGRHLSRSGRLCGPCAEHRYAGRDFTTKKPSPQAILLTAARNALEDFEDLAAGDTTIEQVAGVIIELRNAINGMETPDAERTD
jgi:hypothetical protein